ncbi:hypothetical protein PAXINDRAFT_19320 [Paxillus involutus ATCC 200175]|uniref:Uncharacterized protein n=1 Tax=Paxillus involutus ATCC 200175 TaxID=664439 RepID=A0A0C9T8M3_PAXIN|nr:hypothetical protein PAXINDRAFT_19320 [Paxillus involutus ATCC 200175]
MIREKLAGLPAIRLEVTKRAVSIDMELHITKELDAHPRLRILPVGLKEDILSALSAKADGMFRWVQCQIDTLTECGSAGDVRMASRNLPIGLDKTYERILRAIDGKPFEREHVRRTSTSPTAITRGS